MGFRSIGISFCWAFVLTGFRSTGPKPDRQTDGRMQQRQLNESPTRYGKPVCSSVLAASFPRLILDVECTSASAAMFVDITSLDTDLYFMI